MIGRLAPWRHPRAALAVWSHKLLRWATPWFVLTVLASGTGLAISGDPGYGLVPAAFALAVAAGIAAHAISRTGRKPPRLLAFPRAFAVVNVAFAAGWLNVLRGRQIETWHRDEWRASADDLPDRETR
jgi:hypothetical protein